MPMNRSDYRYRLDTMPKTPTFRARGWSPERDALFETVLSSLRRSRVPCNFGTSGGWYKADAIEAGVRFLGRWLLDPALRAWLAEHPMTLPAVDDTTAREGWPGVGRKRKRRAARRARRARRERSREG